MKRMAQSGLWKVVLTITVAVLFFAAFTAVVNAATIQDAVDAAGPGDTFHQR